MRVLQSVQFLVDRQQSCNTCHGQLTEFHKHLNQLETDVREMERFVQGLRGKATDSQRSISARHILTLLEALKQHRERLKQLLLQHEKIQCSIDSRNQKDIAQLQLKKRQIYEDWMRLDALQKHIDKYSLTLTTLKRLATVCRSREGRITPRQSTSPCAAEISRARSVTDTATRRSRLRWTQSSLFHSSVCSNDSRGPPIRALSVPPAQTERNRPPLTEMLSMPF